MKQNIPALIAALTATALLFSGCGSKNAPATDNTSGETLYEAAADKAPDDTAGGTAADNTSADTEAAEVSVPAKTEADGSVNADIANFYDCVDVLEESGISLGGSGEYLALNADGTGKMFLAMNEDDEEFPMKWTSDGTEVHIYDSEDPDDEGITGTYSAGIIKLDMGGGFYMILSDDTTEEWKKWKEDTDKFMSDFENGAYDDTEGAAGSSSEEENAAPGEADEIANETFRLSSGKWMSYDVDILLDLTGERFTLRFPNGSTAEGTTKFFEKNGLACLELAAESGTLSEGTYIHPNGDRPGHMLYSENGTEYELFRSADFTVNEIMELPAANGYDGTPLSAPVSLDMTANKKITDVRFLKLEMYDVRDDGEPLYNITDLLTVPSIDEGGNFSPTMEFAGDLPGYGIAYKDENGTEHYYSISLSGKDGSVVMAPFGK